MGEGRPRTTVSTPATSETTTGSATETHGANTNLDPNMQGGPTTAADRAVTEEVTDQNAESGLPVAGPTAQD
ncbi:MAG: hypothetical protein Q4C89_02745 [Deinococcus sp.]|uniref:hypothetical protein n=1 Tax=Deinococcus sp. TaxID=47478 RepID=UPI0026DDC8D5|nr:hypothetical protein [Deinococcus sp.]MDO4244923.1 hypothetical protein [Deinococcus sp.]